MIKKIYIGLFGIIFCSILVFFNISKIKDLLMRSYLADIYVEKFRDGHLIDDDHLLTKLDNGMSIIVNKHDRCVCWFVRLTGHWDSNETKVLNSIVKKDFKIVEVGSNFGVHTLRMAELVGKKGRVYAFEANPNVSKYLKQSVELNQLKDRVKVFEMAASNKAYDGFMVYGLPNIGEGYILPDTQESRSLCKKRFCTPIHVKTLDEVIPHDEYIDLLKIDAEGAEFWILEGAISILQQPHLILMMEHVPAHLKRNKIELTQLINLLKRNGFIYIWAVGKGGTLDPITYDDLYLDHVRDIVLKKNPL